jgi:sugar phosphate isomerase/epimerase
VRSGLDPVESLKKYEGRLLCLHLKDPIKPERQAHDVPFGKGVGKIADLLKELKRQSFGGVIAIEYEHNMDNNMPDVAESIAFYNKVIGK